MEYLTFSKEQFEKLKLESLSGNVGVIAFYTGGISDITDNEAKTIKVSKSVEKQDDGLYKVTIKIEAPPKKSLLIQDHIPTGARFEKLGDNRNYYRSEDDYEFYYLTYKERQNIKISYNGCSGKANIVYYIRAVTPGEYVVEAPYVTLYDSNIWGQGERGKLTIK